jgi:ATP-dependent DNA ligase
MKHTRVEQIAATFMLAEVYAPGQFIGGVEYLGMPKLNGVRAMWVPGVGFLSSDGIAYQPRVLPHLESELAPCKSFLDGEFYVHGYSLQKINSIAGVMRTKPHALAETMQFHAFDIPYTTKDAETRMNNIEMLTQNMNHVIPVRWQWIKCYESADTYFHAQLALGYEGAMYKHSGGYRMGRSRLLLKRKGWLDEDFDVVEFIEGEISGKYNGTLGAIICVTAAGEQFKVGSFVFDDDDRAELWQAWQGGSKKARAKVKFLGLTEAKLPYHCQCLSITIK